MCGPNDLTSSTSACWSSTKNAQEMPSRSRIHRAQPFLPRLPNLIRVHSESMPSRREWQVISAILWSLGAYDKQHIYTFLPNSSRKRRISSVEVRKLLSRTPWWSNRTATRRSLTSGAIVAVRTVSEGFKTVLTGDLERSGDEPTEWTLASGVTGWVQDGNSSSSWTGEWSELRGLADVPQTESMIRLLTCKCSARVRLVVKSQILDPNALASVNNLCKLWNSSASPGWRLLLALSSLSRTTKGWRRERRYPRSPVFPLLTIHYGSKSGDNRTRKGWGWKSLIRGSSRKRVGGI